MSGNSLHDPLASAARMFDAAMDPANGRRLVAVGTRIRRGGVFDADELGLAQLLADIEARRQGWSPKRLDELIPITRDRFVMLARRAIRDLDVTAKEQIIQQVEAEYRGEPERVRELVRTALTTLEALRCAPIPPRESVDPYILIDGESFHFHADDGGFFWNRTIPTCPACGDNLALGRKVSGIEQDGNGSPTAIVCFCLARVAVYR